MAAAVSEDQFNKLLDEYRSNQLKFLTTQRPEYQKAAKIAQGAVEDALSAKQEVVNQQRRDMKHFAESYHEGTKEMFTLVEQADDMRGQAQKMVDNYDTSKSRYDAWSLSPSTSVAIDYLNGYGILWRIGVIMILFPLLILVGYYGGEMYYSYSSWFGSPFYGPPYGSVPLRSPLAMRTPFY